MRPIPLQRVPLQMYVVLEKSMMEKRELHRNKAAFKAVSRTQSKIYDGAFMPKQLTICNR